MGEDLDDVQVLVDACPPQVSPSRTGDIVPIPTGRAVDSTFRSSISRSRGQAPARSRLMRCVCVQMLCVWRVSLLSLVRHDRRQRQQRHADTARTGAACTLRPHALSLTCIGCFPQRRARNPGAFADDIDSESTEETEGLEVWSALWLSVDRTVQEPRMMWSPASRAASFPA